MKRTGLFFMLTFVLSAAVYAQAISITMTGTTTGYLYYTKSDGSILSTQCWFKSTTPIGNGIYRGQVSRFTSRSLDGIIMFDGPDYVDQNGNRRSSPINLSSNRGIFIHEGSSPANSDNCVVIPRNIMNQVYSDLRSRYGFNGQIFSIRVER